MIRVISPPGAPYSCLDLSTTVYETPEEARLVRAFLFLAISPCLSLYLPLVYPIMYVLN